MKIKKILGFALTFLLLQVFLVLSTTWGRFTFLITYEVDKGPRGGLLAWAVFLGGVGLGVLWSLLFVRFAREKRMLSLLLLLCVAFAPALYFNTGERASRCYLDGDCVLAGYNCCPVCGYPEEAVNRHHRTLRKRLNLCFLRRECPMINCMPIFQWPEPVCRDNQCEIEIRSSAPRI